MGEAAARAYMSIGEVLALLQGEFPDITVSKIRFLEAEGLDRAAAHPVRLPQVHPRRRGAAALHPHRAARPLPAAAGDQEPAGGRRAGHRPAAAPATGRPAAAGPGRLSRDELLRSAGIDEETLGELEAYGLIAPKARRYDAEALRVARSVGALARFGMQPRHLRAIQAAADRQAALIEQAVAPLLRRRKPGAAAEADESARELVRAAARPARRLCSVWGFEAFSGGKSASGRSAPRGCYVEMRRRSAAGKNAKQAC